VVVTRVRRDSVEFTPRGDLRLEPGDVLRVVGQRQDIAALAAEIGREERRLYETSLVPFAAGIAAGAAVGLIPISLPGGLQIQLGLGGGAFLVALLLGHWGSLGPVRVYVPHAVKQFARELGLVIFLAGAGAAAGQKFVPILKAAGPQLLVAGALVTLVTAAASVAITFLLLRWNVLYGAGALAACMTNPPGLGAAHKLADSDAAGVGFASVYPMALLSKIVFAPLVYLILRYWG
jgi:putative transport protein